MNNRSLSATALIDNNRTARDSNLELFRIIVMFLIVAHHYVFKSNIHSVLINSPLNLNTIFYYVMGSWGKTGVNCFVLITGYFMCTATTISLRKFAKLVIQVVTYSFCIFLIFIITGYEKFSYVELVRAILPIKSIASNFTGCFLAFYLLIPFLNVVVNKIDKNHHLILLGVLLFVYVGCGTAPFNVCFNYVSWFSVLYLIAAFIRKYGLKYTSVRFWGWLSLIMFLVSLSSIFICHKVGINPLYFVADSNKIFAVLLSVSLFMFFLHLKVKRSVLINWIASATFGVFLIHDNSASMVQWLWGDLLHASYQTTSFAYLHLVLSVFGVFVVCVIIDKLRELIVEKPVFAFLDKKINWKRLEY